MKKKGLNKNITWHSLPKEVGEDKTTQKEEEIIASIQEKEASSMQDKKHVLITTKMDQVLRAVHQVKVMKGTIMKLENFFVGITILLLSIFTGDTTLTKPKMSYHKHCLLLIYKTLLMIPCMWTQDQVAKCYIT